MLHYKSISELKRLNKEAGQYFFSRDTMRFFNSIVYPNTYTGQDAWYFVTSERQGEQHPRLYTVRKMYPSGSVFTVGEFQGHHSKKDAIEAAREAAAASYEQEADYETQ